MKPNLLPQVALSANEGNTEAVANRGNDAATIANIRNWMGCVPSRKMPNANIEAGYSHSVARCVTVAAVQTSKRVTFDDAKQEVIVMG